MRTMNDNFKDNKKVSKSLASEDTVFKTSPSVTELLQGKGGKKKSMEDNKVIKAQLNP